MRPEPFFSQEPPCRHGFTLVELSVVLVIIGLLGAAVLVGKDLIRVAELRSQVRQVEQLNTAVNAFRLKYHCLPGDCDHAVALGLGVSGGAGDDGNGDSIVNDPEDAYTLLDCPETENFWYHLGRSGLIAWRGTAGPVPGVNSPPLVMRGESVSGYVDGVWLTAGYQVAHGASDIVVEPAWLLTMLTQVSAPGGVYPPETAFLLDTKMDDGRPFSGTMLAGQHHTGCSAEFCWSTIVFTVANGFAHACIDDRDPLDVKYNAFDPGAHSSDPSTLCMPVIQAGF